MAEQPDAWDYSSSDIPSPLTQEMETAQQSKKVRGVAKQFSDVKGLVLASLLRMVLCKETGNSHFRMTLAYTCIVNHLRSLVLRVTEVLQVASCLDSTHSTLTRSKMMIWTRIATLVMLIRSR